MASSIPRVCCSFALTPSKGGVQYHNAAYAALGLNYTYVAFAIQDIGEAMHAMRTLDIRGCGVNMPFKETIIQYLDKLDPVAAQIKAVNTVVNDDGHLTGYNFDWLAAKRALEEVTPLEGKRAVVLGAGGTCRSISYALKSSGAQVRVYNRTPEKAAALVSEFGLVSAHALDELSAANEYEILVNTTSVGYRAPAESPVPADLIRPGSVVMDVVAEPLETRLLVEAKACGARTVPGWRMRLLQAAEQFHLYTGVQPPLDVMQAALLGGSKS